MQFALRLKALLLLSISLLFMNHAYSETQLSLFLKKIKESSNQYKVTNFNSKADHLNNEKEGYIFDTKGYLYGNYSNEESPQTSPFARASTESHEYGLGVEKLWTSGIKSTVTYSLYDVKNDFFSGNSNQFISPKLELSLSTNIIQDIFYNRYKFLEQEIDDTKDLINLKSSMAKKSELIQSILDHSTILEQNKKIQSQSLLCQNIQKQTTNLKKKYARKTVSIREFLASKREAVTCQISLDELKQVHTESVESFNAVYNTSHNQLLNINLFPFLQKEYKRLSQRVNNNFSPNNRKESQYLEVALKAAQKQQKKLNALTKSDLSLELKAGATGFDENSIDQSNEDISELSFPYLYLGFRSSLPWTSNEAKASAMASQYKIKAIEQEKKINDLKNEKRFNVVTKTIEQDLSIYQKLQSSLKLSRQILTAADKDFRNGRIDFIALADFRNTIIEEQKKVSDHKVKLILKLTEYLDYHNYFDQYI